MTTPIKLDRVFALNECCTGVDPRDYQNTEAYEIDVLADLALITHWSENGRTVEKWKKAFQSTYGVSFDICKIWNLATADHGIILLLNISARIRVLIGSRSRNSAFRILTNCQNLLGM